MNFILFLSLWADLCESNNVVYFRLSFVNLIVRRKSAVQSRADLTDVLQTEYHFLCADFLLCVRYRHMMSRVKLVSHHRHHHYQSPACSHQPASRLPQQNEEIKMRSRKYFLSDFYLFQARMPATPLSARLSVIRWRTWFLTPPSPNHVMTWRIIQLRCINLSGDAQ